jgi:hypothetical protein
MMSAGHTLLECYQARLLLKGRSDSCREIPFSPAKGARGPSGNVTRGSSGRMTGITGQIA